MAGKNDGSSDIYTVYFQLVEEVLEIQDATAKI
jgi:hypothetical protein